MNTKRFMKSLFLILLVAAMALTLFACDNTEDETQGTETGTTQGENPVVEAKSYTYNTYLTLSPSN
jgi:hypothetical protein